MAIRIVRLGSRRLKAEGLRIGTVRRPPRGVRKADYAALDFYDLWFPNLAPSLATMKLGLNARSAAEWRGFARKYRAEMSRPESAHAIELLAAFSHHCDFSVGCYCAEESRCHRSILRELLVQRGACLAPAP